MQELACPLCKHNQCKYFPKYPGSFFFEISDLIKCDNCKLVYASKMAEKKIWITTINLAPIMAACPFMAI